MMEDNKKLLDKPSLQDPYQWLQSIIFAAGFRQKVRKKNIYFVKISKGIKSNCTKNK